jgi:hypothetical protein
MHFVFPDNFNEKDMRKASERTHKKLKKYELYKVNLRCETDTK